MATDLQFVPARKKGYENPVLNGFRFTLDRSRDGTSYWKCCLNKTHNCKARITTVDKQLTSSVPEHTHDVQQAETEVHVAKQNLKRRAATADLPSKFLCAETVSRMGFEAKTKLNCQPKYFINLLSIMSLKLKKVKKLE
jgi:hypothetical protein